MRLAAKPIAGQPVVIGSKPVLIGAKPTIIVGTKPQNIPGGIVVGIRPGITHLGPGQSVNQPGILGHGIVGTPVFLLPSQGPLNPKLLPNLNAINPALGQLMQDAGLVTQNQSNSISAHKDAQIAVKDAQIAEMKADANAAAAQAAFDAAAAKTNKALSDILAAAAAKPGVKNPAMAAALKKAIADETAAKSKLDSMKLTQKKAKATHLAAQVNVAAKKNAANLAVKKKIDICAKLVAHLLQNGFPKI